MPVASPTLTFRYALSCFLLGVCLLQVAHAGDIVKLSTDTYQITERGTNGVFGDTSKLKTRMLREASEFAEKSGKIAIPLSMREIPATPFRFPGLEILFCVVSKDDPALGTELDARPDAAVEADKRITVDVQTGDETKPNPDARPEPPKVYDLRPRGVPTSDAETQIHPFQNGSR